MAKAYRLKNGLSFTTKPEMKAYIRGLELLRETVKLSPTDRTLLNTWLDDAHNCKANDPTEPPKKPRAKKTAAKA